MYNTVELAMFGIGHIAERMKQACGVAKVAIAKATSMRSQVEGWIAALVENEKASTSRVVGEMSQRLEQGLEAVASDTVAMNT